MAYPTTSIISAVLEKFRELAPANFPGGSRPDIYLDSAPLVASGDQVRPPYVVLRDNGQTPTYLEFERVTLEVCEFDLEIYYVDLGDCDTAAAAIRLNGSTRVLALGFDFGSLPALYLSRESHQILRTRERRALAGLSQSGARTHSVTLSYRVTIKESS